MPRNFSELKSGGVNSYAVPRAEKRGTRPPVPHRSTPMLEPINNINTRLQTDMPRNFSELKSGGGQFLYASCPPRLKVGDASPPSPTDRRPCV